MANGNGNGNGTTPTEPPKTVMVPKGPQGGEIARRDFGGDQLANTGETASTAMAAKATATVQARYIVAFKNPRDLMAVRVRLLKDCARPGFADAAIYHKPVGNGIEGPSIRMAEAAARAMQNIASSVTTTYDDAKKRIINVAATDLESNLTFDKDVTVPKTMERSKLKPGQIPLKQRINSNDKPVYLVEAETDDDILNTENALASKALRVCLLRLIPGDILDEAMKEAYHTLEKGIKDDPDKALKSICDWFDMQLGITPAQLAKYLGHPVAETTVAEITLLKKLFSALKDGETSWAEVMEGRASAGTAEPAAATAGKPTVDDLAAKARSKREGATSGAPEKPSDGPPAVESDPPEDRRGDDPMLDDRRKGKAPALSDDDLPPWAGGRKK